jgi:thioredoxin reductase (NADPH)
MLSSGNQTSQYGNSGKGSKFFIAIFFFFLGYVIAIGISKAIDKLDDFILALANNEKKITPTDLTRFLRDPELIPVAILGGGGAGFTAALYLARAGYEPYVFAGRSPGGAIAKTREVHNWPGEKAIDGPMLAQNWKSQAVSNGAILKNMEAVSVDFLQWPFLIKAKDLTSGKLHTFKTLACIITTGATPHYLGVEGESHFWGKGVTNCAICDAALVKNSTAVVVGGGDSAMVEARTLANCAKQVFVLVRGKKLRAKDSANTNLTNLPNIKILFETEVQKIVGDNHGVTSVIARTRKGKVFEIATSGVFLAIGSKANTEIFKEQLQMQPTGCLKLFRGQHTSIPGVFAAGDVTDSIYRQAIIASGDGCKAALQTLEFLETTGVQPKMFSAEQTQMLTTQAQLEEDINGEETDTSKAESAISDTLSDEAKADAPKILDQDKSLPVEEELILNIGTEAEFSKTVSQALATGKIVILDFFGPWCEPCKILHNVLIEVAKEYREKAFFCKVDVDTASELTSTYKIRGVPTLVFFDGNGNELGRMSGSKDAEEIIAMIKNCTA